MLEDVRVVVKPVLLMNQQLPRVENSLDPAAKSRYQLGGHSFERLIQDCPCEPIPHGEGELRRVVVHRGFKKPIGRIVPL